MITSSPIQIKKTLVALIVLIATFTIAFMVFPQQAHAASLSDKLANKALNEYSIAKKTGDYSGTKYWEADGATKREDWCCDFVSYCAEKAGLMKNKYYPSRSRRLYSKKTAVTCNCGSVLSWLQRYGKAVLYSNTGSYIPKKGDICFRQDREDFWGHVGIVASNGNTSGFNVVEGNFGDRLTLRHYSLNTNQWTVFARVTADGNTGVDLSNAYVYGYNSNPFYTAKPIKPSPKVITGGVNTDDFTCSYSNNIDASIDEYAHIHINAKGRNYGSCTADFSIHPPRTVYKLERKVIHPAYTYDGKRYAQGSSTQRIYTTSTSRRDNLIANGFQQTWQSGTPINGEDIYEFYNKYTMHYVYVAESDKRGYSRFNGVFARKCGWQNNGVAFQGNPRHNRTARYYHCDGVEPYRGSLANGNSSSSYKYTHTMFWTCGCYY